MHGVVLTLNGLNTIRNAMIKNPPKRTFNGPRQKNHIPSTATPDNQSVMDTAPPSVFTAVSFILNPDSDMKVLINSKILFNVLYRYRRTKK